jgi:thioredoxin 1
MTLSHSTELMAEDFESQVIDTSHNRPVLLDISAEWCSPCRFLMPILDKLSHEYQDRFLLAKLDVDEGENMKIAGRFQVRGFPTVIAFVNGEEQARFHGAQTEGFVRQFIEDLW